MLFLIVLFTNASTIKKKIVPKIGLIPNINKLCKTNFQEHNRSLYERFKRER